MKIVQPRNAVRVNLDNPLARYMAAAFVGSFGWVDPKGRAEATAAPRLMVAGQGIGQSFTEATVGTGPHYDETPALSMFVMFRKEVDTYGPMFGFGWSRFYSENNGATTDFFRNINGEQTRVGADGPGGSMYAGSLCTALWTHDGTTGVGGYRAWIQGGERSVFNVVSGSPVNYGPGATIYVGGGAGWLLHTVTLAVAFNANLANVNGAVAMLHDDPWSLFESDALPRKIFLPPAVTSTTKRWHPTPVVRTTQPVVPTRVDWSNPITRNLTEALIPMRGRMVSALGRTVTGAGSDGVGIAGNEVLVNGGVIESPKPCGLSNDFTWLVVFRIDSLSDEIELCQHVAPTTNHHRVLFINVNGKLELNEAWHAIDFAAADGEELSVGKQYVLCFTHDKTNNLTRAFCNGREMWWNTFNRAAGETEFERLQLGATNFGTNRPRIALAAEWARVLTANEAIELTKSLRSPWQILAPDPRLAFFDHAAMEQAFVSFVARAYGPDGQRMNTGLRM